MDATLAIAALVFFSLPVIPLYWLEKCELDLPSQVQIELYMVIFCLLWFAFTMGNYADWQIHFDSTDWWFNYWDFSYLGDFLRDGIGNDCAGCLSLLFS